MKILIVGNLGYIGPSIVNQLRTTYPNAELVGFDIGYFAHIFFRNEYLPELQLNKQIYGDIRTISAETLKGFDAIINLAAISNDIMSFKFEEITLDINFRSAIRIAKLAKENGVKSLVFASSCSMYGVAEGNERSEGDPLNPVTTYSRSKMMAESGLEALASGDFTITCLRLATACGWTNRFRVDLVLNDFVVGALINKEISILSDGSPWRPMVNTKDIARAVDWSITRSQKDGGKFLSVNIGSNSMNNQILSIANAVKAVIPGVKISINPDARPDKRSYRVNFELFRKLAPNHQPQEDLVSTIIVLKDNLANMGFNDPKYRESHFVRVNVIDKLLESGKLNPDLQWLFNFNFTR